MKTPSLSVWRRHSRRVGDAVVHAHAFNGSSLASRITPLSGSPWLVHRDQHVGAGHAALHVADGTADDMLAGSIPGVKRPRLVVGRETPVIERPGVRERVAVEVCGSA